MLDGLDFDGRAGTTVAITGASGSGKTTLLSVLGGLDRPQGGASSSAGTRSRARPRRDRRAYRREVVGFVFQDFGLLGQLTALENVELALTFAHASRRRRRARARELLDAVGLADRVGHRPRALSGGEKQRVAIARALANEPQLAPRRRTDRQSRRRLVGRGARPAAACPGRTRDDGRCRHSRRSRRGAHRPAHAPRRRPDRRVMTWRDAIALARAQCRAARRPRGAHRARGRPRRCAPVVIADRQHRRQTTCARSGQRRWAAVGHQGRRSCALPGRARQRQPPTRTAPTYRRRRAAVDRAPSRCRRRSSRSSRPRCCSSRPRACPRPRTRPAATVARSSTRSIGIDLSRINDLPVTLLAGRLPDLRSQTEVAVTSDFLSRHRDHDRERAGHRRDGAHAWCTP